MTRRLRLGTRGSPLARAQTELVARALRRARPDLDVEPVSLVTSGDRDRRVGGSPDFTDAIDRALLDGSVDLGVHSAKDLPVEDPPGLALAACPRRADPRDCLVTTAGARASTLPRGARVGSSSPRRRAQLLRWRSDLTPVEIRGNVETRLSRVRRGELDAVILACAGLERLGRAEEITRRLPVKEFLPAPAQGALGLVARVDDASTTRLAHRVDHPPTHAAVDAERAFAASLGADCRRPVAALARVVPAGLQLEGEVLSPDGRLRLRACRIGPSARPRAVGRALATALLDRGAAVLLARVR